MRRIVDSVGSRLPHGWGDLGVQIGLIVLANVCYETVRGIAEGQASQAFANAAWIVDFERSTGTFFEPGLQAAILGQQWLVDAANWAYMNTHFVITTAFLAWLYLRRNEIFYFVRNMFLFAMGLALVGYTLLPTAPPRFLPQEGFVDTIEAYVGVGQNSALVELFINPYAAVPSMHVAFALMIGITGVLVARHLVTKIVWALYAPMVTFVVIVTGNHFWIDAAAGAVVAGASALVASRVLARVRPDVWAWRPAGRETVNA